MPLTTPETRRDVAYTTTTRRFSLMTLVLSCLASLIIGFLGGQGMEKNNADVLPGGAPTDNVSGPTPTDNK